MHFLRATQKSMTKINVKTGVMMVYLNGPCFLVSKGVKSIALDGFVFIKKTTEAILKTNAL